LGGAQKNKGTRYQGCLAQWEKGQNYHDENKKDTQFTSVSKKKLGREREVKIGKDLYLGLLVREMNKAKETTSTVRTCQELGKERVWGG